MAEKPTKDDISRRKKKTEAVHRLAERITGLRNQVTRDLKSDDDKTRLTALAVALMDLTAERVGNEDSAAEGHVGVTGFKKENVTVSGNKVRLKYVGKSGVDHDKEFTDALVASVVKDCLGRCEGKGDFVLVTADGFKVKADRVNRYLKDFEITAKDIRGYSANNMVVEALRGRKVPDEEKDRKKVFGEVLKMVAEQVGHGKPTLKKHYLLPDLEPEYVKNGKIPSIKKASREATLTDRVVHSLYIPASCRNSMKNIQEDARPETQAEGRVRDAMAFFAVQHDYPAAEWYFVEKFCLYLAAATDEAAVAWATSSGLMDYVRFLVPFYNEWVVVECVGFKHDGIRTVSTSVYGVGQQKAVTVAYLDPCSGAASWALRAMTMLNESGADCGAAIADLQMREQLAIPARAMMAGLIDEVEDAYINLFGECSEMPKDITLMVGDWNLRPGKIGSYRFDSSLPWGVMTLGMNAFRKGSQMVRWVTTHELCHAAIGKGEEEHGEKFQAMAEHFGIPKEYQD